MVVAYTIGRILIPLLFIVSGIQRAINVQTIAKALADYQVPFPDQIVPYLGGVPKYEMLGYVIAGIEIICGLMVLVGLKARWGALILIVFTACTIIFSWDATAPLFGPNQVEALKYVSIIGGLLTVVAVGSGPGAMDRHG